MTGTRAHSSAFVVGRQRNPRIGCQCWTGWPSTEARSVDIDGCTYQEGPLGGARSRHGVAGSVIPDAASVTINYRCPHDRSVKRGITACP